MAESVVQPDMINRTAYEELRAADMPEDQAKAVAAQLPDWSQFATKQDLKQGLAELESRLIRWMVGIFVGSMTVGGGPPHGPDHHRQPAAFVPFPPRA